MTIKKGHLFRKGMCAIYFNMHITKFIKILKIYTCSFIDIINLNSKHYTALVSFFVDNLTNTCTIDIWFYLNHKRCNPEWKPLLQKSRVQSSGQVHVYVFSIDIIIIDIFSKYCCFIIKII